jgi:hypothetical protein
MRKLAQRQPGSVLAGTTPVPNHLLDEVMPRLSDTQLRVLLVVVRSTLGWQVGNRRKEKDWISHRQLQARTGRSSAVVSRAVAGLVAQGMIRVTDANDRELADTSQRSRNRGHLFYSLGPKSLISPEEPTTPHGDRNRISGDSKSKASRRVIDPIPPNTALESSSTASETLPHKVRATKETRTKEINTKGVWRRGSEDPNFPALAYPSSTTIGPPLDELHEFSGIEAATELTAMATGFIATFERIYEERWPGYVAPALKREDHIVLLNQINLHGAKELEAWLPSFFDCSFSYVSRSGYSLRTFLDSLKILQATSFSRHENPGTGTRPGSAPS